MVRILALGLALIASAALVASVAGGSGVTGAQAPQHEQGIHPAQQPKPEHFNCYTLTVLSAGPNQNVKLVDQFGERAGKVVRKDPKRDTLCNPVKKNAEAFVNKKDHLRCYRVNAPVEPKKAQVSLRNQFHVFQAEVDLTRPQRLCLPSAKALDPQPPPADPTFKTEHFLCYAIKPVDTPKNPFKERTPTLKDQFFGIKPRITRPNALCTPVAKNGKELKNSVEHLVCYPYKKVPKTKTVRVRNQFGLEKLRTAAATTLCVPSTKKLT